MAKLIWAVTCRRLILDEATGAVSYIDAVNALAARRLPAPFPRLTIGTLWERSAADEELATKIKVIAPDGMELLAREAPVQVLEKRFHRFNFTLGGFPAQVTGTYRIVLQMREGRKWRTVVELPILVEIEDGEGANVP